LFSKFHSNFYLKKLKFLSVYLTTFISALALADQKPLR
jgi:hypothetical protein